MVPIALVFDLDDTLYLERDFARSGFAAAGDWLQQELGIGGFAETCWRIFEAGDRARIFDQALQSMGREPDAAMVELLVDIYRTHEPSILLAPDAGRYLAGLGKGAMTALITDGPCGTQQAKIRALGLDKILDFIVCTDALGKGFGKPHPLGFELVEKWAAASSMPLVYIADNQLKDFVTPRARGWSTIQIQRPERVHLVKTTDRLHEPDRRIATFDELDGCLKELQSSGFALPGIPSRGEAFIQR